MKFHRLNGEENQKENRSAIWRWWWLIMTPMFEFNAKIQYDACSLLLFKFILDARCVIHSHIHTFVRLCERMLVLSWSNARNNGGWTNLKAASLFSALSFIHIRTHAHTDTLSLAFEFSRNFSLSLWTHTGKSRICMNKFLLIFFSFSRRSLNVRVCACGISLVFFSLNSFYVQPNNFHLIILTSYISEIRSIDSIYFLLNLNSKNPIKTNSIRPCPDSI